MDKANRKLKNASACFGCGACIAVCPKQAIEKRTAVLGTWVPEIRADRCIDCGLCEKVCKDGVPQNDFDKKAYIAYNRNQQMRRQSASGGVFSALASYILERGGSVFGAELYFEDGKVVVEHNRITQIKELPRLLGSKYVQSDTVNAYAQVRTELQSGNVVLFSGCSCQIAGLKNYLASTDTEKLYTIDLICHGVPSIDLLNSYMMFLGKKHHGVVKSWSFRAKENGKTENGMQIVYRIDAVIEGNGQKEKTLQIPFDKSGYYLAFMGQQSYRDACYQCPYASLEKPADLTTGDYFEVKEDYPELFTGDDPLLEDGGLSCVIAHTAKGQALMTEAEEYLYLKEASAQKIQNSHLNLQRPSKASFERRILRSGYEKCGYAFLEYYYQLRQPVVGLLKRIRNMMKK